MKYRVIFDLGLGRSDHVIYNKDFDYKIDAINLMTEGKALFHKQGYVFKGTYENWWMYENEEKGLRSRCVVQYIDDDPPRQGTIFRRKKTSEDS